MKNKLIICIVSISLILVTLLVYNFTTKESNKDLTTVKLAEVTHSVFYTPMYVAIENGYFEEVGINLELILTPGADKVSAAVLSGDANIGFAGAESAIYIYEAGEEDYLQIFAGLTKRDGQFIVSREDIKDFTLNDLIGKEIIAGRSTGMPALNFINSLDNAGINTNEINIDTSIDFAAMTGAFIGGTGDFINVFEPNATILEKEGYGYIVANVGKLSGEVPYTTYYAKKSYIDNNYDLLLSFNKAIQKGLDFTYNNESTVVAESIINQFPDTNINDLSLMIDNYKENDSWLKNTIVTEESFNNLEDFLIKFDLLENITDYNKVVTNINE